ncbi:MAG: TldD/PmbA family protein [bacterium]|nr:TldD/PmbA family protein [bacterium]
MKDLLDFLPDKSGFPKGVYWEVRLERRNVTSINVKNGEAETITRNDTDRGNVRVLDKGGWGFSSFSRFDDVPKYVKKASGFARSVGGGDAKVIELPSVEKKITAPYERHPDEVPFSEKLDTTLAYDAALREHPKADLTEVNYTDTVTRTVFLNSDGRLIDKEEIFTLGVLRLLGKVNGVPESAYRGFRHRGGFEEFAGCGHLMPKVFKRLDDLLTAEDASGGKFDIIIDPILTGVFAHEAFGHTSEADFFYRDKKQQEVMKIGNRLGSDAVSIIDDATMDPKYCGSYAYDDEGVEGKRTVLLENGILKEHLHSRMTAAMMKEEVTGNARSINVSHPPVVRMTNTFIEPGEASYEELLEELGDGLLVVDSRGGSGGEEFTFSAGIGYLVENGEVTKPLKNLTVSGNLFTTLKNITACSNEIEMHNPGGGCGKAGQAPLPVGLGGPYVMIKDALIGGR